MADFRDELIEGLLERCESSEVTAATFDDALAQTLAEIKRKHHLDDQQMTELEEWGRGEREFLCELGQLHGAVTGLRRRAEELLGAPQPTRSN